MDEIKLALLTKAELAAQVAHLEGEIVGYKNDLQNVREMLDAAIERAEAAEALARRQANGLQWAWYALIMAWQVPSPYYFYWMKLLNILIGQTAEAQKED